MCEARLPAPLVGAVPVSLFQCGRRTGPAEACEDESAQRKGGRGAALCIGFRRPEIRPRIPGKPACNSSALYGTVNPRLSVHRAKPVWPTALGAEDCKEERCNPPRTGGECAGDAMRAFLLLTIVCSVNAQAPRPQPPAPIKSRHQLARCHQQLPASSRPPFLLLTPTPHLYPRQAWRTG